MALSFSDGSIMPYAVGFLVVEYAALFIYLNKDKLHALKVGSSFSSAGSFSSHGSSADMKNLDDASELIANLRNMVSSLKIEGQGLEKIEADIAALEKDRDAARELVNKKDPTAKSKINSIVDSIISVQQEIEKIAAS